MVEVTMSVGIRFSNDLVSISDVSLGGFSVRTNEGKLITFDFQDVYLDYGNSTKVLIAFLEHVDLVKYPDAAGITENELSSITRIEEFVVRGEASPVCLDYMFFELPEQGDKQIEVEKEVLDSVNFIYETNKNKGE